jgi:hypothetical protein
MSNKGLQKLTLTETIEKEGTYLVKALYKVKDDIAEAEARNLLLRIADFGGKLYHENEKQIEGNETIKALWNGLNDELLEAFDKTPQTFRTLLRIDMPSMRHQRWERNHSFILSTISSITLEDGRAPDIRRICAKTGLSRQTVSKHLNGFKRSEYYQDHLDTYKMLEKRVLDKMYRLVMNESDVRAAKIFLDYLKTTTDKAGVTNNSYTQNNFIQVNGLKFTEEQIVSLPEDQQLKITRYLLKTISKKQ